MSVSGRAWPGWDGWVLIGLGLTGLVVYFARGQVAGLWPLSLVLCFDLIWLSVTWWYRR